MIKSIKTLKEFGIFKDYPSEANKIKDFARYNLFYGWNASGKSTLSNLFYCIENRDLLESYPQAKFEVNVENCPPITSANLNTFNTNIFTFNGCFIKENIEWGETIKSILLVDKQKIDERKKLEQLKVEQESDNQLLSKNSEETINLINKMEKIKSDSAKEIKENFQIINTKDNYYLYYNKRNFENFIGENLKSIESLDNALLEEQRINELIVAAKAGEKPSILFELGSIDSKIFDRAKDRMNDLLESSVINQAIQRLVDHSDIKDWVEVGLNLYKNHETSQCEFCGNRITGERIKELEGHFNEAYKAFHERLAKAVEWLPEHHIKVPTEILETKLHEEFQEEYRLAYINLKKTIEVFNNEIDVWSNILKEKIKNPLEKNFAVNAITQSSIDAFSSVRDVIKNIVDKHNSKCENFGKEKKRAQKRLELHYAADKMKNFSYYQKENESAAQKSKNNELASNIAKRRSEIEKLETSLSNEKLGAKQFNENLHRFLGHNELTLRFDESKKGYEILRYGSEPADNLSEGEKTAIAFIYFITKIEENDNKVEDAIVVIDDPISSFDSNHLFNAFAFMEDKFDSAKQLFVLTHNFTYFKLVREWFSRKNKKGAVSNAVFYTVEAPTTEAPTSEAPTTEAPIAWRQATIKDIDDSLLYYGSEYHFVFSCLYKYISKQKFSLEDWFLAANLARRLLESFLKFKRPAHRGPFKELMEDVLKDFSMDKTMVKRMYKFINVYSHSEGMETDGNSQQNLLGESPSVIQDIFKCIEKVDESHYKSMINLIEEK